MPTEIEAAILDHVLAYPCHGATRVEQELRLKGLQVSSGGVRGVWMRHNLLTKRERLGRYMFETIEKAQRIAKEWLWAYNHERPNIGIGGITPAQKLQLAA